MPALPPLRFPGVFSDARALLALAVPIRDRAPPPPADDVIEGEYRRPD